MPDDNYLEDILERRLRPTKTNPTVGSTLRPVHMNLAYHGFIRKLKPTFSSEEYREAVQKDLPEDPPQRVIDLS